MRSKLLSANYGPRFRGWVGRTPGGLVCVAPATYETDAGVRGVMRELVAIQGGDCGACQGCPIGRLGRR